MSADTLAERVARVTPVRAGVDEAAAVRVDEAAKQRLGVALQELARPVDEPDQTLVLAAAAVLREKTRPRARVRGYLAVRSRRAVRESTGASYPAHLVAGDELRDRSGTLVGDAGVPRVQEEAQPVDAARVRGNAAVAEIETERVHVLARERGELVRRSVASAARSVRGAGDPTPQPIADRRA